MTAVIPKIIQSQGSLLGKANKHINKSKKYVSIA